MYNNNLRISTNYGALRGLECPAHTSSAHQMLPVSSTNWGIPDEETAARSARSTPVLGVLSRDSFMMTFVPAFPDWVQRTCVPQNAVSSLRRRVHCFPPLRMATHRSSAAGGERGAGGGARAYVSTKVRASAMVASRTVMSVADAMASRRLITPARRRSRCATARGTEEVIVVGVGSISDGDNIYRCR